MLEAASLALALALALDLALGEWPKRYHPVVWLGRLIEFQTRLAPKSGRMSQFIFGAFIALLDIALFALPAYWLVVYLRGEWPLAYVVVSAVLLKTSFSFRALRQAALRLKRLLEGGKIEEARLHMRDLVSRDTSQLDEPHLVSATVESVAENTCDSLVAPLFNFLLLGVPGALAYRAANTLDAMIGYHGPYEYLGKFSARLDDVLNFIPARLTALLIVAIAWLRRRHESKQAWRIMGRDHGRTASPNAGWPMSAMAGALGVRLEKVGHYQLGDPVWPLSPGKIKDSVALMQGASALWVMLSIGAEVIGLAYSP